MGPKKASGAQNRKRKVLLEKEDRMYAGALKRLFGKSSESSSQSADTPLETSEQHEIEGHSEVVEEHEDILMLPQSTIECAISAEGSEDADPSLQQSSSPLLGIINDEPESSGSAENVHDTSDTEGLSLCLGIDPDPALWPKLNSATIDFIVQKGPVQVKKSEFKKDERNRHFCNDFYRRSLDNGEFQARRWLIYSKSVNKVFCFCCKLFDTKARTSLAAEGSRDWTHMSTTLKSHETSNSHFLAEKKWMETQLRLENKTTIDQHFQNRIIQERKHWRGVLERLIHITQLLAERNLAFRGSSDRLFTPNNGNFLALVQLLGKYDVVMSEHLRKVTSKESADHYCGKTIQNELINLMAKQVINRIIERCQKAKYYSLILDCTTDVSHLEQMSFTIRFLEENSLKYEIKEYFLGYKSVTNTTGRGLSEVIFTFLSNKELDINNCRGQGYDNGANMAGKKNGVQANILRKNPRAVFMPCGCHNLNLVIADAARSNQRSKDLFGIIQCIYNLFSGSAKRWKILTDHVSGFTVKPLCTTRWECRINCIKPLIHNIGGVQEALIALAEDPSTDPKTSHEALSLSQQIVEFDFIVALLVWYDLLYQINIVSKVMQHESADLITATHLIKKTYEFLKSFRETGFDSSLQAARKLAEDNGVEPVFKTNTRVRIKKTLSEYEGRDQPLTDPILKFKVDFFNILVDTATNSLEERFQQMESHNEIWGFLYNIKSLPTGNELEEKCLKLQTSLTSGSNYDINGAELGDELRHMQALLSEETVTPIQILNFITKNGLMDTFSNIWIALRILLTIPVSVASGERSFSKLKLIKTYLRSTMCEERLSSLAVLSIENDVLSSVDLNNVIDEFARAKARRVAL